MKRLILVPICSVGFLLIAASVVKAGFKDTHYVHAASSYGYGTVGDARNSANGNEYIGCEVFTTTGSATTALCFAQQDSPSYYTACSTDNAAMITAALSITSISYIELGVSAGGDCTYLTVANDSTERPSTP